MGDHIVIVLELVERSDWTEGFLGCDDHFFGAIAEYGRLEELPSKCVTIAARQYLRPLGLGILDMGFRLVDRRRLDQRPLHDTIIHAIADLECLDRLCEFLGECVVDLILHVDAVGAYAGLARVSELRADSSFDRRIQIGVVENDHRCMAAEFHRNLLNGVGGLLHELTADLGRAGECDLANEIIGRELTADRTRTSGDDI